LGVRAIPDDSNDDYNAYDSYGVRANERDNGKRSERDDVNDINEEQSTGRAATSRRLSRAPLSVAIELQQRQRQGSRGPVHDSDSTR
jgi:hypothetical protein